MHIKKFEARDLQDALNQIREELGPEALILESRTNPGAQGGVVVLAAKPRSAPGGPVSASPAAQTLAPSSRGLPSSARELRAPGGASPLGAGLAALLRAEMGDSLPSSDSASEIHPSEERANYLSRLVRSDHFSAIPLPLRELYLELVDAEVDSTLVYQLLRRMGSAPLPGKFLSSASGEVLALLRSLVTTGGAIGAGSGRRVLALVGPTGVGKTTTVAKIAGTAAFHLGRQVALLSTDAYRVFGAQHLASYAALMGIPFEAAGTQAEVRWLLQNRLQQADLVLVDTSGRSPRDEEGIREIHTLLAACPELEVHLVLAANGRVRDLGLALESFSQLPIRNLIFTKVDEATTRGGIYSTALKARRPVSYLGTGQEVPDDLMPATVEGLTEGLLGSNPRGET